MPVCECAPAARGICETVILVLSMTNWAAVIYAFLDKTKRKIPVLTLNLFLFLLQFCLLQVFISVMEENLFDRGSVVFYPFTGLPVVLFLAISLFGFVIGIISIFLFTDRKRRRVTDDGIPKENMMLHKRALQLQKDMVRLAEMNEQMRMYGEEMQEQIKEKEILEAKMNIHSGMNRLLLSSQCAMEGNDDGEIEDAVTLWRRDALLLCREADSKPIEELLPDLRSLAKSLGLQLECNNIEQIQDEKTLMLFYKTACECMTNAAKHAGADRFIITAGENSISFSNNGIMPLTLAFEPHGGLQTVKEKAEDAGYSVDFEITDVFSLILRKRGIQNGI